MTADLVRHCLDNLPAYVPDAFERNADLTAFVNDCGRYADDPDYRAKVDADRAARQAEVYARMDAGIARFRAIRERNQ